MFLAGLMHLLQQEAIGEEDDHQGLGEAVEVAIEEDTEDMEDMEEDKQADMTQ
jgi:hypothetical protein